MIFASDDSVNNISNSVSEKYLPSLDGLRGVSIIMVVVSHLKFQKSYLIDISCNGHLGVNIFFVLSGFLITTLCIKEKKITGKLSLKSFYVRRILRIFPVAYLYLFVIYFLNFVFKLNVANFQLLGAMFYLTNLNYFKSHSFTWFTGHYWSLSVEEQFYILFPFILKVRENIFLYCVLFIAFLLPLLCSLQEFFPFINHGIAYAFTHYFIKFQAISVGCLVSLLSFKKYFDYKFLRNTKYIGNIIALIIIVYLRYDDFYSIKAIYTNLLISLLTAYLIVSNISKSKDLIYQFLNNKILSFIGILSYSIYMWQQLFTSNDSKLPSMLVSFPTNLFFIVLIPILSYFLYEKYFLTLKSKFSILK